MAIGLCSALKMNQWLGSRAAQPMAGKPARMGGASGYIMQPFAKAPQIFSPSATTTGSSLYETRSLCSWTSPGTCEEKSAMQRISALRDEWAYTGCTPTYLTLSPQRVFTRSLHPPGPVFLCDCEWSGLIWWKRWWRDGRQPVIGGFRCGGAVRLVPLPHPLSFCTAQRIQPRHGCRYFPHPV